MRPDHEQTQPEQRATHDRSQWNTNLPGDGRAVSIEGHGIQPRERGQHPEGLVGVGPVVPIRLTHGQTNGGKPRRDGDCEGEARGREMSDNKGKSGRRRVAFGVAPPATTVTEYGRETKRQRQGATELANDRGTVGAASRDD